MQLNQIKAIEIEIGVKSSVLVNSCGIARDSLLLTSKIDIIKEALNRDIPFISSMGAASKMKPELFQIDDINNTSHCPVAKRIRKKLRSQKVTGKIPVIYSKEEPQKLDSWKYSPSSNAFVPGVAGLICASYIINKLIE